MSNPLQQSPKKPAAAQIFSASALLLLGNLVACQPPAVEPTASLVAPSDSGCGESGRLQTALFGSIETALKWSGSDMMCESMQRPDGEGLRMRFSGNVGGEQLSIIIAIPGLRQGEAAVELPSNVTASVEGSGRFFSTADLNSCWTDVSSQTAVSDAQTSYVTSGSLFCLKPLGEVNGEAAITIPELSFTTIVIWNEK